MLENPRWNFHLFVKCCWAWIFSVAVLATVPVSLQRTVNNVRCFASIHSTDCLPLAMKLMRLMKLMKLMRLMKLNQISVLGLVPPGGP
jgi:hypothetical protein